MYPSKKVWFELFRYKIGSLDFKHCVLKSCVVFEKTICLFQPQINEGTIPAEFSVLIYRFESSASKIYQKKTKRNGFADQVQFSKASSEKKCEEWPV